MSMQDEEDGGISDRPDDMVDVYHTFFGIAALSLLGYPGLAPVDPSYALPVDTVARIQQQQQQQQQGQQQQGQQQGQIQEDKQQQGQQEQDAAS
jgi:geranylgeranyl transferase type-2 subunit beta